VAEWVVRAGGAEAVPPISAQPDKVVEAAAANINRAARMGVFINGFYFV
jgi:hypothetical protein